jgi:hypothetical protein
MGAPTRVPAEQLEDLHIRVVEEEPVAVSRQPPGASLIADS